MKDKILQLKQCALNDVAGAQSTRQLSDIKVKYLGKNGEVTALLKGMKSVPNEEKPLVGKMVNDLRCAIEEEIGKVEADLKQLELSSKLSSEAIDITMPGKATKVGNLHPVNLVKNQLIDAFTGLGFKIFEGPEVELDYYNFQQLNIPEDHPARDTQDTFYITENILLRTQTSAGQIRCMENEKPPIKILSPGRVYRSDYDATHSPMFHQMEGLVVDKGITLCDLKGVLEEVCKKVFAPNVKTRLRPSYFPFTEPSVEIDVSCSECGGKGCSLCKGTGWIEILGAGMVNRSVLKNCGVDPDVYSGFAFGLGLERIAMLKYGIPDIRYLFDNDIRFLKQF